MLGFVRILSTHYCLFTTLQADASVRRRQLASLDLFLESARKQLDTLMEEKPET